MPPSTTAGVDRFTLQNGLTVLIKERHVAPVVALLAYVRAGYFNEPDPWNGLSHVIEHMFFKGTTTRPGKAQVAEEVRALGGTINASTYYEQTQYHVVVPAEHFAEALDLQADTFLNPLFDPDELAREIEVIVQESKQKRDSPGALLLETMYARAFDAHRIRRWRIGPDEVLRALRRDDLLSYFSQTYRPQNIVLAVVGDIDPARTRDLVERQWGAMPRGVLRRDDSPTEPARTGFRYERMRGDIQQRLVEIGFAAPPVLDRESASLMVLGALLSDGRSARLYRSLKEDQRLVNSAWAAYEGFEHLGVFTMGAECVGDDPLPVEQALWREAARLRDEGPAAEELDRVKTRVRSRRVYAQEGVLGMARTLAAYEALGDYRLADEMLARLQAVGHGDVCAAAERTLGPDRATLVEYWPAAADAPEAGTATVERSVAEAWSPAGRRVRARPAAPRAGGAEVVDRVLPCGARLLFRPRHDLPIVAVQVAFRGGRRAETPATAGHTNLATRAAIKGTDRLTAADIAARVEGLGSGIGLLLAPDYFGFAMKLLSDRAAEGMPILKEVLSRPTFEAAEVDREKHAVLGEIRRHLDSMSARATDLLAAACYADHPYGLPAAGSAEAVLAQGPEHVRAWYERWGRSGNAVVAVVGDIDEGRLVDLLADAVLPGGAVDTAPAVETAPPREMAADVERHQTAAVMGFPGVRIGHDDRHALDLVAEIASGLAGRFFQAVRGANALAYAVSGFHRARRDAGNFIAYTATSPENERRARDILLSECARFGREPVSAGELHDARAAIRGRYVIEMQGFSAQAAELAATAALGLPVDEPERYLARLDSVTAEEICHVAGKYLRPEQGWLGVVRGRDPRAVPAT